MTTVLRVTRVAAACAALVGAAEARRSTDTAAPVDPVGLQQVVARIDQLAPELLEMAEWMYRNPEFGHQEHGAVKLLTGYLKAHGFEVETGIAGFPTAFRARFSAGAGGPHIGFVVEYDGLRGKQGSAFHGCQHNIQGPAAIGAAIALSEYMQRTGRSGSISVIGTPAEEIPPPVKRAMYERGAFSGLEFLTKVHGSTTTVRKKPGIGGCCSVPINAVKFTFRGKATSANVPVGRRKPIGERRNALEALILFFNAAEQLRGTARPETIIQGVILEGGEAMNVQPEVTIADFSLRYPGGRDYLEQVTARLAEAAKAAARTTGTEVEVDVYGRYDKGISLDAMNVRSFEYAKAYGATNIADEEGQPTSYDESGIVAQNIPGFGVSVQTSPDGTPGHSHENAAASVAEVGRRGTIIASKVMASVMFDVLTDADYRRAVIEEHAEWRKVIGRTAMTETAPRK